MNVFFSHENGKYPPSISELGELKPTVKSDLVECLEQLISPSQSVPHVDAKVLDGAVVIHLLKPRGSRTFKEFIKDDIFKALTSSHVIEPPSTTSADVLLLFPTSPSEATDASLHCTGAACSMVCST